MSIATILLAWTLSMGLCKQFGPFIGAGLIDGSIYCSAATKEILLRLEKASIRLNYAKGILENPRLQTYKHLEKKLKPIPLDTPTTISLLPGRNIRVTLIDANHCVGAVMFLFEGHGKAVLYTGDVRCEPRLITAITQNPNLVEYTSGWKTLDRIYLDTSILDDFPLQTKAEGLRELLQKVHKYPKDTIFHFQAWTYGYEEVWIALSKALDSRIHVDEYKMRVFESLVTRPKDNRWATQTHLAKEAPALVGFTCGNRPHEGCLTRDETVRIHSCEKGMGCSVMESKSVVWIRPIVTHLKGGQEVREVGIGGGGEDLAQATTLTPEDILDALKQLPADDTPPAVLYPYMDMIKNTLNNGRDISLVADYEDLPEGKGFPRLMKALSSKLEAMCNPIKQGDEMTADAPLPNIIRFPYARHSSLPELRELVGAFRPKDIIPCTFDADLWLQKGWAIKGLFGDYCSDDVFVYDEILRQRSKELAMRQPEAEQKRDSQHTTDSAPHESSPPTPAAEGSPVLGSIVLLSDTPMQGQKETRQDTRHEPRSVSSGSEMGKSRKRDYGSFRNGTDSDGAPNLQGDSQVSEISDGTYKARRRAFDIATANIDGESWEVIGLISTTDHHTILDKELGRPYSRH